MTVARVDNDDTAFKCSSNHRIVKVSAPQRGQKVLIEQRDVHVEQTLMALNVHVG